MLKAALLYFDFLVSVVGCSLVRCRVVVAGWENSSASRIDTLNDLIGRSLQKLAYKTDIGLQQHDCVRFVLQLHLS